MFKKNNQLLIVLSFEIVDKKSKLSNFEADRTKTAEARTEWNFADVILWDTKIYYK